MSVSVATRARCVCAMCSPSCHFVPFNMLRLEYRTRFCCACVLHFAHHFTSLAFFQLHTRLNLSTEVMQSGSNLLSLRCLGEGCCPCLLSAFVHTQRKSPDPIGTRKREPLSALLVLRRGNTGEHKVMNAFWIFYISRFCVTHQVHSQTIVSERRQIGNELLPRTGRLPCLTLRL